MMEILLGIDSLKNLVVDGIWRYDFLSPVKYMYTLQTQGLNKRHF